MKKIVILFLITAQISFAQQPVRKDLQDAMKAYQKMMNDPQIKKMMNDSSVKKLMGNGKMPPDANTLKQQINFATQNTARQYKNSVSGIETLPKKDVARIAALPKNILTDQQLISYIQNVQTAIGKRIAAAAKKYADKTYEELIKAHEEPKYIAGAANWWWVHGSPEIALYLMGRAVNLDVNDADNLNNYASILSMMGGEHLALPILQKLNQKYPGNSTLLNNIGQAWFGLGNMITSEKYLDSAIHLFAMHSAANYTKCYIEAAKGNKEVAIECLQKSIQNGYSKSKENKLRELGGKLNSNSLLWNFPKPQDALGLDKILADRPDKFFTTVETAVQVLPQWQEYARQVKGLMKKYTADHQKALEVFKRADQNNVTNLASIMNGKGIVSNFIQIKARRLIELLGEEWKEYFIRINNKAIAVTQDLFNEERALAKKDDEILSELQKNAGMENYQQAYCGKTYPLIDAFLGKYNPQFEDMSIDFINHLKRYINDLLFYSRYAYADDYYEVTKDEWILVFLDGIDKGFYASISNADEPISSSGGMLATAPILYLPKGGLCASLEKIEHPVTKLRDFDEIHCDNHITLNMGICEAKWDCNTETDKCDFEVAKFDYKTNLNTGDYNTHIELGYSKSIGSKSFGPIKSEASIGGGAFIEFGNGGVSDIGVIVKAEVSAGVDLGEHPDYGKVEPSGTVMGVETKWGYNSGPSLSGQGLLSSLSINKN